MTGQENRDLLIQVTFWVGFIVYTVHVYTSVN